ncbi:hypothetical protein [Pararhizobium sp.]|uniref:hypothetical protein n=1 Tax=Pararhizobium sp. TaxID=1977563 RepID=UPI003D0E6AB4
MKRVEMSESDETAVVPMEEFHKARAALKSGPSPDYKCPNCGTMCYLIDLKPLGKDYKRVQWTCCGYVEEVVH